MVIISPEWMIIFAIIAIVCGLILNLIFNLMRYPNLFSSKENKRNYLLILILTGVVLTLASFSGLAVILLIFYGIAGLSVPQMGIYLMIINELKSQMGILRDFLYILDIPEFVRDKEQGLSCSEIEIKTLEKSKNYIRLGVLDQKRADEYLAAIKLATRCY